jgi:antitoxin component of MazEF toxin-antitoxin module
MKQLIKHGDSLALVIDKPILDLLKIDADTPLEISMDGDHLIIKPYRGDPERASVKGALAWVNSRYDDALKRLAE